jgi:hypothetical protein
MNATTPPRARERDKNVARENRITDDAPSPARTKPCLVPVERVSPQPFLDPSLDRISHGRDARESFGRSTLSMANEHDSKNIGGIPLLPGQQGTWSHARLLPMGLAPTPTPGDGWCILRTVGTQHNLDVDETLEALVHFTQPELNENMAAFLHHSDHEVWNEGGTLACLLPQLHADYQTCYDICIAGHSRLPSVPHQAFTHV